ncbi:AraC family transcriptional regulator [Pedobacter sp. Leaf250]|uniref:helix-turn-helix transcriptional regulator n=1 Tax=Pedobacter sp. Leaf250 TaxID=2876559 RepID=UPI001E43DE99|nr:AraC family transcriptional regulator [Pedobacter sp. Leaf250]
MLKKFVQYFLFFRKPDAGLVSYSTFPNNNLCLAIYKENKIEYTSDSKSNHCIVSKDSSSFKSRLFGFHKMPFHVNVHSALDQICILFEPAALTAFTNESYQDLLSADHVFDIFGRNSHFLLEEIFDDEDLFKRAEKLEHILMSNLKIRQPEKLKEALDFISTGSDHLTIDMLAKKLGISPPTLFRLFKYNVGLNPKSYINTNRFRNILNEILQRKQALTSVAHANLYYDQAHFIKDFKAFSGYSPKQLINKISIEQNNLAWIYQNKNHR